MNRRTFERRRQAWAETARGMEIHEDSNATRLVHPDGAHTHSFLGAGLETIMSRNPGMIEWNEPVTGRDGRTFQSVDDTTEVLAEYYALSVDSVDNIDELDCGMMGKEGLIRTLMESSYILQVPA